MLSVAVLSAKYSLEDNDKTICSHLKHELQLDSSPEHRKTPSWKKRWYLRSNLENKIIYNLYFVGIETYYICHSSVGLQQ